MELGTIVRANLAQTNFQKDDIVYDAIIWMQNDKLVNTLAIHDLFKFQSSTHGFKGVYIESKTNAQRPFCVQMNLFPCIHPFTMSVAAGFDVLGHCDLQMVKAAKESIAIALFS